MGLHRSKLIPVERFIVQQNTKERPFVSGTLPVMKPPSLQRPGTHSPWRGISRRFRRAPQNVSQSSPPTRALMSSGLPRGSVLRPVDRELAPCLAVRVGNMLLIVHRSHSRIMDSSDVPQHFDYNLSLLTCPAGAPLAHLAIGSSTSHGPDGPGIGDMGPYELRYSTLGPLAGAPPSSPSTEPHMITGKYH